MKITLVATAFLVCIALGQANPQWPFERFWPNSGQQGQGSAPGQQGFGGNSRDRQGQDSRGQQGQGLGFPGRGDRNNSPQGEEGSRGQQEPGRGSQGQQGSGFGRGFGRGLPGSGRGPQGFGQEGQGFGGFNRPIPTARANSAAPTSADSVTSSTVSASSSQPADVYTSSTSSASGDVSSSTA